MVEQNISVYSSYLGTLRNSLESQILSQCPDSRLNGHPEQRLPNTSSLTFKGPKANDILESFGSVAASAGAACHSDSITVSSVLEAMNVPIAYAMGTLRLSALPWQIALLADLKSLDLKGDRLPPAEILEARDDPARIIDYFLEHLEAEAGR